MYIMIILKKPFTIVVGRHFMVLNKTIINTLERYLRVEVVGLDMVEGRSGVDMVMGKGSNIISVGRLELDKQYLAFALKILD